ncbi:hypothetical protein QQS21_011015 [Conoideocrella luteorostrata]|uniref:Uncharacterized protein n=1 Tax=Conoideocrella luteorostrata TaxID=1105319 RepID=A0AAJ0FNX8_9HYPO|nr:hypothetical protein QQS21_011015 [Conoideocrella luteorostrata]
MRDAVYEQMLTDRSTGMAQSRKLPKSLATFGTIASASSAGIFTNPNQLMSDHRPENTDRVNAQRMAEYRQISKDLLLDAVDVHWADEMADAIDWEIFGDSATNSTTTDTIMLNDMSTAIAMYIASKDGSYPNHESLEGLIRLMEPVTHGNPSRAGSSSVRTG